MNLILVPYGNARKKIFQIFLLAKNGHSKQRSYFNIHSTFFFEHQAISGHFKHTLVHKKLNKLADH